mmetsp:Transcript_28599/g.45962  ORF Transcript_28599/g.45962 Transcript_28599/m.45962 type:complete len:87 (-) Transcript_28599:9-269(-)
MNPNPFLESNHFTLPFNLSCSDAAVSSVHKARRNIEVEDKFKSVEVLMTPLFCFKTLFVHIEKKGLRRLRAMKLILMIVKVGGSLE